MQSVSLEDRPLVAIATTSNEELHRELNYVWDQVHGIHRPIMELKLRIFRLFKLLAHNRAMYNPVLRQSSQQVVFGRIVQDLSPWNVNTWTEWCKQKTALASTTERQTFAKRLKTWRAEKSISGVPLTKRVKKRTAFTKRSGFKALLVKQAAFKRLSAKKRARKL